MNKIEKSGKKNISILQRIIYFVVIPIILLVMVLLVIYSVTGNNIFETVDRLINNAQTSNSIEDENQMLRLEAELKNEQEKVADLEAQLVSKGEEIEALKEEIEMIENPPDTTEESEVKEENSETEKEWKAMVRTYENMKSKNAAAILINMDEKVALNIMAELKEQTLASILETMPSDRAADLTTKLLN